MRINALVTVYLVIWIASTNDRWGSDPREPKIRNRSSEYVKCSGCFVVGPTRNDGNVSKETNRLSIPRRRRRVQIDLTEQVANECGKRFWRRQ